MKKWFVDVWEEDMPMRERRLKVWKLGFQDFKGIDYVNNPEVKKKSDDSRADIKSSHQRNSPGSLVGFTWMGISPSTAEPKRG